MDDADRVSQEHKGDGGPADVSAEDLERFKTELQNLATNAAGPLARREWAESTLFCRWDGQSEDGRKHATAMGGRKPFPFEGASDGRLRLADMVVRERAAILTTAATKALATITGMEANDMEFAGRISTLFRWTIQNQIGQQVRRETKKVALWQEGDSPGAAVLGIFWQREWALEMRKIQLEEVMGYLEETYGELLSEYDRDDMFSMLSDPARTAEGAALIEQLIPEVSKERARQVVKQFSENGEAEFPHKYLRVNLPRLQAYRLFEDIFFPIGTEQDLEHARVVFVREWLSEARLKERVISYGYSRTFVEEVLKHKGQTAFPESASETTTSGAEFERLSTELHSEDYEVITAFYRAVNEDWVPAWYVMTFSSQVALPAKQREILPYAHGKSPFVYFQREFLTQLIVDTRGCAELVAADQANLKMLNDSYLDHASITTLPPMLVPASRGQAEFVIAPLAKNKYVGRDKPEYMQGPEYPRTNVDQQKLIAQRIDQYFARLVEGNHQQLVQLMMQDMVDDFLVSYKEAMMRLIQLEQQYMTDEDISRIVGGEGLMLPRGRSEIQGRFDLTLSYDVRDQDVGHIEKVAKVIGTLIMPMDRKQTIKDNELVAWLMKGLNPTLAERLLDPVEKANMREVTDEENNFVKMLSELEPPMVDKGQNFGLRLQWMQTELAKRQQNPQMFAAPSPLARELLTNRLKHLEFQVTQQKNALVGRMGAKAVMEEEG
jgi:hypothetical protein